MTSGRIPRKERSPDEVRDGAIFNAADATIRLLTPRNRQLLALIRDHQPESVAALVRLSGRKQPNLARTLANLEAAGFVALVLNGRRRVPKILIAKIVIDIDPFSATDRLSITRATAPE